MFFDHMSSKSGERWNNEGVEDNAANADSKYSPSGIEEEVDDGRQEPQFRELFGVFGQEELSRVLGDYNEVKKNGTMRFIHVTGEKAENSRKTGFYTTRKCAAFVVESSAFTPLYRRKCDGILIFRCTVPHCHSRLLIDEYSNYVCHENCEHPENQDVVKYNQMTYSLTQLVESALSRMADEVLPPSDVHVESTAEEDFMDNEFKDLNKNDNNDYEEDDHTLKDGSASEYHSEMIACPSCSELLDPSLLESHMEDHVNRENQDSNNYGSSSKSTNYWNILENSSCDPDADRQFWDRFIELKQTLKNESMENENKNERETEREGIAEGSSSRTDDADEIVFDFEAESTSSTCSDEYQYLKDPNASSDKKTIRETEKLSCPCRFCEAKRDFHNHFPRRRKFCFQSDVLDAGYDMGIRPLDEEEVDRLVLGSLYEADSQYDNSEQLSSSMKVTGTRYVKRPRKTHNTEYWKEYPYSCAICNRKYMVKSTLHAHLQSDYHKLKVAKSNEGKQKEVLTGKFSKKLMDTNIRTERTIEKEKDVDDGKEKNDKNETKTEKPKGRTYSCEICLRTLKTSKTLATHNKGMMHKLRMELIAKYGWNDFERDEKTGKLRFRKAEPENDSNEHDSNLNNLEQNEKIAEMEGVEQAEKEAQSENTSSLHSKPSELNTEVEDDQQMDENSNHVQKTAEVDDPITGKDIKAEPIDDHQMEQKENDCDKLIHHIIHDHNYNTTIFT